MARNLCDFYVFKSPTQLAAKYVNAVLSQVEAQSTANALLKQYGAQFVCGINKGGASGPPRAPIKSGATAVGSLPACWVYAGKPHAIVDEKLSNVMPAIVKTCFPERTDAEWYNLSVEDQNLLLQQAKALKARGRCGAKSSGEMPHQGPLVPAMSTSFLRPSTTPRSGADQANPAYPRNPFGPNPGPPTSPVTSVRLAGAEGDGMLGAVVFRFVIAAWNGNKLVGQWGYDVTASVGWGDKAEGGPSGAAAFHNWSKAKAKGATRVCAALIETTLGSFDKSVQTPGAKFICFDGKHYWQQGQTAPMGIQCPQGQVWDNTAKKCVPGQKGMTFDVKTFDAPAPLVSRGEQPHQGPLTMQTQLNTSFMRPQRVAGIEEQPMFRWIEKTVQPQQRDERAIEARLHGIGRDDEDESGELGRSYVPGTRPGPQTDYTNYPVQQKQPKLLTKYWKPFRVMVALNQRNLLLDAMIEAEDHQHAAGKVWHGQPLPAMPAIGSPSATANMLAEMQKWTVSMRVYDKGKLVATYQCVPGQKCTTPGLVLKGYALTPEGQMAGVGAPQFGLGAAPALIKKWFPERTDAEWDNLDQADQFTLNQQANLVEAQWNAKIYEMRGNGACDATKPGLLAGAMREYLIKNGGKLENMDDLGDKSFGPKDCAEWWAVFKKAPDQETVAKGIGLVTGGTNVWVKNSANGYTRQITLNMVCPNGFKLPSCPAPGGGGGGKGGGGVIDPCKDVTCMSGQKCVDGKCVPVPSETKKTNWGLVLLALAAGGGLIAAAASAAMPKAPKLPPREADRLKANKRGCANC